LTGIERQGAIEMNNGLILEVIDWESSGYFGCPEPPPGIEQAPVLPTNPYMLWLVALQRAKRGQFDLLPRLIELYEQESDYVLKCLCTFLLGDAGTAPCFQTIIQRVNQEFAETTNYEITLDFCDALHSRGRLADVPLLLAAYESFSYLSEADIIPCYLSHLLEYPIGTLIDPVNFASPTAYREAVMDRYQQMKVELGGDQVFVFGGQRFGVVRFAQLFLDRMRHPHVQDFWRRKFEASTGINCSVFYQDGRFQPLSAAAVVEEFLESPSANRYEDGVRYFWGHRIPD
jgi:hypothetical protein